MDQRVSILLVTSKSVRASPDGLWIPAGVSCFISTKKTWGRYHPRRGRKDQWQPPTAEVGCRRAWLVLWWRYVTRLMQSCRHLRFLSLLPCFFFHLAVDWLWWWCVRRHSPRKARNSGNARSPSLVWWKPSVCRANVKDSSRVNEIKLISENWWSRYENMSDVDQDDKVTGWWMTREQDDKEKNDNGCNSWHGYCSSLLMAAAWKHGLCHRTKHLDLLPYPAYTYGTTR